MNRFTGCALLLFIFSPVAIANSPLLEQAKTALAKVAPETDALTSLDKRVSVDVQADQVVTTVTQIWFYPNTAVVQDSGFESVYYRPDIETLNVITAGAISPDGEFTAATPDNIKEIESDTYNTFTDTRQAVVSYPGLQAGGATLIQYTLTHPFTEQRDYWSSKYYPQVHANILNYQFEATWTEQRPFFVVNNSARVDCELQDNRITCTGSDIPPAETDEDVSWPDVLNHISVTTLRSWEEVQQIVLRGFNNAIKDSSQLESLVTRLIEGQDTQEAQIAAIFEFVAKDIRYVSMSENGHAIVPHDIDETINNRFGDCKDKSALLLAMLRHIGVDADPVLVATKKSNIDNITLPAVNTFDHVVVCFDVEDGVRCLDATDPYTGPDDIADWIQNRVALSLSGKGELEQIPASTYRWDLATDTRIDFAPDGGQTEQQEVSYHNAYEGQIRGKLAKLSAKDRQEWASDLYQSVVADGAAPAFTFEGIDNLSDTLKSASATSFEPYFTTEGRFTLEEADAWVQYELSTSGIDNTVYDVFYPGSRVKSTYTLTFPKGWYIDRPPKKLDLQHAFGSLQRQVKHQQPKDGQQVLKVTTVLQIPSRTLTAADFSRFNQFVKALHKESMLTFAGQAGN
ncbi:DUF3857 domain-containing protein [Alteromonas sp. ASW11-19]|uniref:DUF3857 domain-containing protein n=1 Tax=Alteromonas salexigens TaxID=2982530 RepID=A0ABT2VRH8_9ALTE|nr:transglutaminase domain-containing protein [Alteromonas salexigens]MCU7555919.1 DUF3857 domain-containing protein [Alteromonas salexigens]